MVRKHCSMSLQFLTRDHCLIFQGCISSSINIYDNNAEISKNFPPNQFQTLRWSWSPRQKNAFFMSGETIYRVAFRWDSKTMHKNLIKVIQGVKTNRPLEENVSPSSMRFECYRNKIKSHWNLQFEFYCVEYWIFFT